MSSGDYFKIETPLKVTIRTTEEYWQQIVTIKHPSISKYEDQVKLALESPNEIRRSKKDLQVHLYYLSIGKLNVCVVADHITRTKGYIITAYLTDRIKEGEQIYVKNKP